jgi:LemA protein
MTSNWKNHLPLIIAAGVILLLIFWTIGAYNGIVRAEVNTDTSWGQVESVYQRRADLIPNLVETVKGIRDFEKDTFTAITEARSAWQSASTPQQQVAAANGLEGAISKLLLVVENYPDLKANQNFLALQDELAGTENRISVARQRYNEEVGTYNKKIRVFPNVIIANMAGFEKREFFESDEGADTVPQVTFE